MKRVDGNERIVHAYASRWKIYKHVSLLSCLELNDAFQPLNIGTKRFGRVLLRVDLNYALEVNKKRIAFMLANETRRDFGLDNESTVSPFFPFFCILLLFPYSRLPANIALTILVDKLKVATKDRWFHNMSVYDKAVSVKAATLYLSLQACFDVGTTIFIMFCRAH